MDGVRGAGLAPAPEGAERRMECGGKEGDGLAPAPEGRSGAWNV